MFGTVSEEIEVKVSTTEAWELYGTLGLAKLVEAELTRVIHKVEIIQGDGGVGRVIKLTFTPGDRRFFLLTRRSLHTEDKKQVNEVELIEGAYLDV